MVAGSSASYPQAALSGSLLLSLVLAILVAALYGSHDMWFFLSLFLPLLILFNEILTRVPSFCRLFAAKQAITEAVERASLAAFYARGITRTDSNTGILLYVSVLERRVRVVADKGINEHVAPDTWDELVGGIVGGIRSGDPSGAIASAVDRCGGMLEQHFPIQPGDKNELENRVIIG
jgi:putative membrane protein